MKKTNKPDLVHKKRACEKCTVHTVYGQRKIYNGKESDAQAEFI